MLLSVPVSTPYESVVTASSPQLVLGSTQNIISSANVASPMSDMCDDSQLKLTNYLQKLSGEEEPEVDIIMLDHCYTKPLNWLPETSFMRPTKTLFMHRKNPDAIIFSSPQEEDEGEIDVTNDTSTPTPIYDLEKAKKLMDECEAFAAAVRMQDNDDWEDSINKESWTPTQHRLFNKMLRILHNDRLARLAHSESWNEPILRRLSVDKSVKRTRHLFSSVYWEKALVQWLHALLIENLSISYLASYLDILQRLKSKVPTLVDKMMFSPNMLNKIGPTSNESLFPLLRRPWDPVAYTLNQNKLKKLPGNPILLICPSAPNSKPNQTKRLHNWTTLLSHLGTVITVHANIGSAGNRMTMINCLDQMIVATRAKIQELQNDCPSRPIILVGVQTGGAVACQVAEMESVTAVVCLGFPLLTPEGPRGEADDSLLELQVPVLFVIGQCAHLASPEEMEDLRERMRIETGLVVVGGGDDFLRVAMKKRKQEGITQSMVDRCIMDEVGDFLGSILISPHPPQLRQSPVYTTTTVEQTVKKPKLGVKRRTSTVGRPPKDSRPPKPHKIKIPTFQETSSTWKTTDSPMNICISDVYNPTSTTVIYSSELPSHISQNTGNSLHASQSSHPSAINAELHIKSNTIPKNASALNKHTNKNLSTADELRNSNSIDAVNRAVQNILPSSQSPATSVYTAMKNPMVSQIETSPNSLSTFLQGGNVRCSGSFNNSYVTSTDHPSRVKIFDNVSVTSGKVINAGRPIDLSKIAFMNCTSGGKMITNVDKMVILEGKMEQNPSELPTFVSTIKTTSEMFTKNNQTQIKPVVINSQAQVKFLPKNSSVIRSTNIIKSGLGRKIFTTRPRLKTASIMKPASLSDTTISNNLTPADLSNTNILDIPIIFADNESSLMIHENDSDAVNSNNISTNLESEIIQEHVSDSGSDENRLLLMNKQSGVFNNCNVTSNNMYNTDDLLTRPHSIQAPGVLKSGNASPSVKYTKIILSKRNVSNEGTKVTNSVINSGNNVYTTIADSSQTNTFSGPFDGIDLEDQIKAITLPKPIQTTIVNAQAIKNKPEVKILSSTKLANVVKSDRNTINVMKSKPEISYSQNKKFDSSTNSSLPGIMKTTVKIMSKPRILNNTLITSNSNTNLVTSISNRNVSNIASKNLYEIISTDNVSKFSTSVTNIEDSHDEHICDPSEM